MSTFRTSDGVELAFVDSGGTGLPIVFVHGWAQTQSMFRYQQTGFPDRRVITFDQRGHGASGKPATGYRISRLAADLNDLLNHLGILTVDLVGWSMGASVAWCYIDVYGTRRIRKLVLVDQPAAIAAMPWMTQQERRASGTEFDVSLLAARIDGLRGVDGATVLSTMELAMFSGRTDPAILEFVLTEGKTIPPGVAAQLLFDHATQDWRGVLPHIDVPTLVIGCEGSHVSVRSQKYVAAQIPGAELEIFTREIANSHFPFLENPAAFNARVERFLNAAPGSRS